MPILWEKIMIETKALPCIICGKELEQIMSGSYNHPNHACVGQSYGNYGSTVFDPMDGSFLEFNICDPCLIAHKKSIRIVDQTEEVSEFNPTQL